MVKLEKFSDSKYLKFGPFETKIRLRFDTSGLKQLTEAVE